MHAVAVGYERVCRVILLVFTVNCLMLLHSLLGLVVLGLFPAVSAAVATYRTWLLDEDRSWGPVRTTRVFHEAWRAELRGANLWGWAQAGLGALLAWDYYLANWNALGGALGVAVSGVLLLTVVLFAVGALTSWVVRAHYDAGPGWVARTTALLLVARPACLLSMVALVGIVGWSWVRWPGVGLAFGASMVLAAVVACVYSFGRLPGFSARQDLSVMDGQAAMPQQSEPDTGTVPARVGDAA